MGLIIDESGPDAPSAAGSEPSAVRYYPIPLLRLLVFSLASLGVFQIYYLYRNFKYIKHRDHSDIWPFVRAVFGGITYFALVRDVEGRSQRALKRTVVLGLLYFLTAASWRLPEPWWLLSMTSVLVLLPTAHRINTLNESVMASSVKPITPWQVLLLGLGFVVVGLAVVGTLFMPPSRLIQGDELSRGDRQALQQAGIVESSEPIRFLYADGVSLSDSGVALTDQRVISYGTSEEAPVVEGLALSNVKDVRIIRPGSQLSDTQVLIRAREGNDLTISLPTADQGDQHFIAAVRDLSSKNRR